MGGNLKKEALGSCFLLSTLTNWRRTAIRRKTSTATMYTLGMGIVALHSRTVLRQLASTRSAFHSLTMQRSRRSFGARLNGRSNNSRPFRKYGIKSYPSTTPPRPRNEFLKGVILAVRLMPPQKLHHCWHN